jgi:hypothetical protein
LTARHLRPLLTPPALTLCQPAVAGLPGECGTGTTIGISFRCSLPR